MGTRLLLIAVDSGAPDLVLQWAADGTLPTFQRLLTTASRHDIHNPPGFFGGTVWPTFATGSSPARHGRYCAFQAERGAYLTEPFDSTAIGGRQFWELLSDAGRRVAVLDVPLSRPSPGLNGLQTVDFSTHDGYFDPAIMVPEGRCKALRTTFGPGFPDDCEGRSDSLYDAPGVEAFTGDMLARVQAKGALSRHTLDQEPWDLLLTVFGESHCVGHQCWHLHDRSHPGHPPQVTAVTGDPVRRVYQAIDAEIGALLHAAGNDIETWVWLSHGMGRATGDFSTVLDEILHRLDPAEKPLATGIFRRLKRNWYELPLGLRRLGPLRALKDKVAPGLRSRLLVPQRRDRTFFALPSDTSVGAIRINKAGREQGGSVNAGDEFRSVLNRLAEEILNIVDPESGIAIARGIHVPADLYQGPRLETLPDLLVEWNLDHAFSRVQSDTIGELNIPPLLGRSGDHRSHGLLFRVNGACQAAGAGDPVAVEHLAPSICRILGVAGDGMDGRPVLALVGE